MRHQLTHIQPAMAQQFFFAQAEYKAKCKTTRHDRFSSEMDIVVPWARLL